MENRANDDPGRTENPDRLPDGGAELVGIGEAAAAALLHGQPAIEKPPEGHQRPQAVECRIAGRSNRCPHYGGDGRREDAPAQKDIAVADLETAFGLGNHAGYQLDALLFVEFPALAEFVQTRLCARTP